MSRATANTQARSGGDVERRLAGIGLWVPDLQPQPQVLHAVRPAPCTQKCPAGVQVKAYVSLIAEERFGEALEVIRRRCPLPGICGRICHHPCEAACKRQRYDDPIAIRALKRFVADNEREFPLPAPPPGPPRAAKVAVIGSGPAGLTAAYDLRLAGFGVTVIDGESEPGGMLRHGIAAYRLPRDVLDQEIEVIARTGIEFRTGTRVGRDVELGSIADEFDATLLAVGAQRGRALSIENEDQYDEVEDALGFLRRVNAGDRTPVGRRVLVIGGGSTAIEAARVSLRLGAESVQLVYRRSREELLAAAEEIAAAEHEGVHMRFLVAPVRAVGGGGSLTGLECAQVGLREHDASGRRQPVLIPGTEHVLPADRVLAAVGQEIDPGFLPPHGRTDLVRHHRVLVEEATALTRLSKVFAAGDMVSGPATVIEAIAAGHRAAESIRHLLEEGRAGIREDRPERDAALELELSDHPPLEQPRIDPPVRAAAAGSGFAEVEMVYDRHAAVSEARRCLRCGPCGECKVCAGTCQRRQVLVRSPGNERPREDVVVRVPASIALSLDGSEPTKGWLLPQAEPAPAGAPDTRDGTEIEVLPMRARVEVERCRACGNCVEACPFGAVSLTRSRWGNGGNGSARPGATTGATTGATATGGAATFEHARVDPSLCRGCNLCTAVCPTSAIEATALSPSWWARRVDEALPGDTSVAPAVVIACQRRAGSLDDVPMLHARRLELIRLRCVGQLQAGMLLQLLARGAPRVLVAGCRSDRCRFGDGSRLAKVQFDQARAVLSQLGEDEARLADDWSDSRAHDRLEDVVERFASRPGSRPAPRSAPEFPAARTTGKETR